jgi:hypothetical protein
VTPDMAFECLLISRDPSVVSPLNHVLQDLSISTKICVSHSKVLDELRTGSTDLVVIDWVDDNSSSKLLSDIRECDVVQKKTLVAVSSLDRPIPGAHMVLTKPITTESGAKGLKFVYDLMLRDHRRHARYAVMVPVLITDGENRLLPVRITNIGDGGIGLSTNERLTIGDVLSCRVLLPGARRAIYMEARVLWTREFGIAGCEFVRIPPLDLDILHEWLKNKCQVKKPLVVQ